MPSIAQLTNTGGEKKLFSEDCWDDNKLPQLPNLMLLVCGDSVLNLINIRFHNEVETYGWSTNDSSAVGRVAAASAAVVVLIVLNLTMNVKTESYFCTA